MATARLVLLLVLAAAFIATANAKFLGFGEDNERSAALKAARTVLGVNQFAQCKGNKKPYARQSALLQTDDKGSLTIEKVNQQQFSYCCCTPARSILMLCMSYLPNPFQALEKAYHVLIQSKKCKRASYEKLGIEENANCTTIRKAWFDKSLILHPDKGGDVDQVMLHFHFYTTVYNCTHALHQRS
jgi:hypothetical protein